MNVRGQKLNIEGLGVRRIRQSRKPFRCTGWHIAKKHDVPKGTLYIETELAPDVAGGFGSYRCCLECLNTTAYDQAIVDEHLAALDIDRSHASPSWKPQP